MQHLHLFSVPVNLKSLLLLLKLHLFNILKKRNFWCWLILHMKFIVVALGQRTKKDRLKSLYIIPCKAVTFCSTGGLFRWLCAKHNDNSSTTGASFYLSNYIQLKPFQRLDSWEYYVCGKKKIRDSTVASKRIQI